MSLLRLRKGKGQGKVYQITGKSCIIGRDPEVGVQIHDKAASREHAEIFKLGEMYFIRDLKSRNGTLVNGELIDEELLREGDIIQIGETELAYQEKEMSDEEVLTEGENLLFDDNADLGSTVEFHLDEIRGAKMSEMSKESENLKTLYQIGKIIGSEKSGLKLMDEILDLVLKKTNADNVYIFIKDSETGKFKPVAKKIDKIAGVTKVSRTIIKKAINEIRSILTNNAMSDERFESKDSIVMNRVRSVICAPLVTQHKVNGVLYISRNRPGEGGFESEDLELATAIATMVGMALESLRSKREQHELFMSMIKVLISAGELRQPETKGHSERVSLIATNIAKKMELSPKDVSQVRHASLLHDVGRIGFPASSESADFLKQEERRRQCVTTAEKILENAEQLEYLVKPIKHQYEKWDGTGIPDGLQGEDIPLFARIISVANTFDIMTTRGGLTGEGLSTKEAIGELRTLTGKEYDKKVVKALEACSEDGTLFGDESYLSISS